MTLAVSDLYEVSPVHGVDVEDSGGSSGLLGPNSEVTDFRCFEGTCRFHI